MDTLIAMRSFVRAVETGSFSAVAKEEIPLKPLAGAGLSFIPSWLASPYIESGGVSAYFKRALPSLPH